jgi:hypothetical protein
VTVAAAAVASDVVTVVLGNDATKLTTLARRSRPLEGSTRVVPLASVVVRVTPLPASTPLRRATSPSRALCLKLCFSASVMLATVWSVVNGTKTLVWSSGTSVGALLAPVSVGAAVGNKRGRLSVGATLVGDTVTGACEAGAGVSVGAVVVGANDTGARVIVGAPVAGAKETGASDAVGATVVGAYDAGARVPVGAMVVGAIVVGVWVWPGPNGVRRSRRPEEVGCPM